MKNMTRVGDVAYLGVQLALFIEVYRLRRLKIRSTYFTLFLILRQPPDAVVEKTSLLLRRNCAEAWVPPCFREKNVFHKTITPRKKPLKFNCTQKGRYLKTQSDLQRNTWNNGNYLFCLYLWSFNLTKLPHIEIVAGLSGQLHFDKSFLRNSFFRAQRQNLRNNFQCDWKPGIQMREKEGDEITRARERGPDFTIANCQSARQSAS